ncbi:lanthionine synthetase C family protein [Thermosporothrix hazakensis]|nr:lanthionine synthetase C family protein [Thermosporothrix hazakensis]
MDDPNTIAAIAQQALNQSSVPGKWIPSSFSFGFAGIAFMYSVLARSFPESVYIQTAHRFFSLAVQSTQHYPLFSPALFDGTSSMGTLLSQLCHIDSRYLPLKRTLDHNLCEQILSFPLPCNEQRGVAASEYDVVSGAAGILAYLLTISEQEEITRQAIEKLLQYLLWLTNLREDGLFYRWLIPYSLLSTGSKRQEYPQGMYDCGLAHGIAGPLAALACAYRAYDKHDVSSAEIAGAIQRCATWLIEQQITDEWGINWPAAVNIAGPQKEARAARCYGAPGISCALWLAGKALSRTAWRRLAIEALEAVLRRPAAKTWLISPTFCHGLAGLLQICNRFAHEGDSGLICSRISSLTSQILDTFHSDYPLGFRDREESNREVDQISWLTGAPGIIMVLLATATDVEPSWDHAFLSHNSVSR